jgi:hypothetical protein
VAKAGRLALETKDKEASRILYQLADDLDRYIRPRSLCHGATGGTGANTAKAEDATKTLKPGCWPNLGNWSL